jgi:hypothetical protein
MKIETVSFNNQNYPKFQSKGNASQFAIPFAKHVCSGYGVDIGCMKEEWAFPGANLVDPLLKDNSFMPGYSTQCDLLQSPTINWEQHL